MSADIIGFTPSQSQAQIIVVKLYITDTLIDLCPQNSK